MKLRQVITIFAILAGFIIFLTNWQVCLPDGCVYNPQSPVCQDGNCLNEDIESHLQERSSFLVAIVKSILPLLLIIGVLLFLFSNNKTQLLEHQGKFKIVSRFFSFNHNLFTFLFAKGILNPKIF